MTDVGNASKSGPGAPTAGDSTIECHGARLRVYARSTATVVTLDGEIDASNAEWVSANIRGLVALGDALVLDMSGVEFLSLHGLRAVFALDADCSQAGVTWMLVASDPVRRMVRIGDRDCALPQVGSVVSALQRLGESKSTRADAPRQLVSPGARPGSPT
jgi:anti-anti-sigma factor